MFIQTESTPNPDTLKFLPNTEVSPSEPFNYLSKEDASNSRLARELFEIPEVKAVFFGNNFISITKQSESNWTVAKPIILATIMDHFVAGLPVFDNVADIKTASSNQINENDDEIVKQIKEIIETRVRPAVAQDGGDIIFNNFTNGVVQVELHGACSGCPSSTITLKNGIENMLKHYIPEVIAVESI